MKKLIALFFAMVFCVVPCSCLIFHADSPTTGEDVLNDTRYSAIGLDDIFTLIGLLDAIKDGELSPNLDVNTLIQRFAKQVAEQSTKNAIDEANKQIFTHDNFEPYTIKGSRMILCKRTLVYPYADMKETDYLYIYEDANSTTQTPQQFGDYMITPNSMLLIRDTNFMGTTVCSFPLTSYCRIGGGSPNNIIINTPPNELFYYDTPEGQALEYVYFASNSHYFSIPIVNSQTNTIRNDWLVRAYQTNLQEYRDYIGADGAILDDFEVLLGTGYDNVATGRYNRTMCQSNSGAFTVQPWYITTAYYNDSTSVNHINQYFNTDPNNIDPSKPPAYRLDPNNPLGYNKTIDNSTINNYYDYGITYDSTNNELDIDPTLLAGALAGLIDPDFKGVVDGTFSAQPEIGLDFNTPLDLNLPDLVDDYLQSITVYPPSDGWEPPSYPAVNTSTYIPASVPSYETYALQTIPDEYIEGSGDWFFFGYDLIDSLGLLVFVIPLVILGLFWRFTGGD